MGLTLQKLWEKSKAVGEFFVFIVFCSRAEIPAVGHNSLNSFINWASPTVKLITVREAKWHRDAAQIKSVELDSAASTALFALWYL